MVFARRGDDGLELILPIAYIVQMKSWGGEDPRGVRALLSQLQPDVASNVASHYLGRPATLPIALSLEPAWQALVDPAPLRRQIEELATLEAKLLTAIEEVGGEVDTEELLDLEREPMRLRGATGATPSRRGVGFALERRGFLIPVHPNRHLIPSEVVAIVGAQRRMRREQQRERIRHFVIGEDHAPRRARFAQDPVPLALAIALVVRDPTIEVRAGVGTPRSLIAKLASRFGRSSEAAALVASLSRAIGLWDPSAIGVSSPPGSSTVDDLHRLLCDAWRRGGAWDAARPDGEVLRAPAEAREASPAGVVKEMVLEALHELGAGRWAPWKAIEAYVRADTRTPGLKRLLDRWALRAGVEPKTPEHIARRIALESLHILGVVDLGETDSDDEAGWAIRITPRGRAFFSDRQPRIPVVESRFLDNHALRIGPAARAGHVIALSPFVEIGQVGVDLDLTVTPQTLSLALSAGYEADVITSRFEALAPLPDPIARILVQASAVIGRAEFVATPGFIWVEDPEIRELLSTRRQTADLFINPSPPSGLLVAPGVDLDRLARRCRTLGVEVMYEGEVYRTRSSAPQSRGSGARKLEIPPSSRSDRNIPSSGSRPRRPSSTSMRAVKSTDGDR
jgi:hypothetical protein